MKKLHRFFLSSIPDSESFEITDTDLVHQLATVLRYEVGETFIVFSEGNDDVVVHIESISKKSVSVTKVETIPGIKIDKKVIAAVSIIKRDLFELVVQKLTELGVREIIPIISDRTIKQTIRLDRLQMISKEATEQSGQHTLVKIHEPMKLEQALAQFQFPSVVFDPREPETAMETSDTVVMYIGPEGGWSDEDIEVFKQHGAHFQKLGSTILRTETAAIVGAYSLL